MKTYLRWVLVCVLIISFLPFQTAQAASGIPGSPDFGYGAWLYLDGKYFDQGLALLQDLNLDWIAIEVDWAELAETSSSQINTTRLDQAVNAAAASGTAVMLSLTNAPDWAMTGNGPDASTATDLILSIWKIYGEKVFAVELFPGANTSRGWGANPNPSAYAEHFFTGKKRACPGWQPPSIDCRRPPAAAKWNRQFGLE